ncbi:MAG: hypothetical protein ACRD0P_00645 [Stackebrandtia sp.]
MPLVATRLLRSTAVAPHTVEQPETVVGYGAVRAHDSGATVSA